MLDALIQNIFHFGAAWIGQDAAVAERARSPLRAALIPAKNFAVSQFARCCVDHTVFIQFLNFDSIVPRSALGDRARNLRSRKSRAPSHVLHHEGARPAENRMLDGKRSADRQASIARSRLHVYALEWRVLEHLSVRHAIESHSAREAQGFLLCARR